MRVLLDANIIISYLLSPASASPIGRLMHACFAGRFVLLLPQALVDEVVATVDGRPHLGRRLTVAQTRELFDLLSLVAELLPPIPAGDIPRVTPDPKDDYLVAYALLGEADFLVTGDDHLLRLGQAENARILTPTDFVALLASSREA